MAVRAAVPALLGAVLGSLGALAVPSAWRRGGPRPDADLPRPVTRGRRLLAMLCDALGSALLGWSAMRDAVLRVQGAATSEAEEA